MQLILPEILLNAFLPGISVPWEKFTSFTFSPFYYVRYLIQSF